MRSERFFRFLASGSFRLTAAVFVISALEMVVIQMYGAKNNSTPQFGRARPMTPLVRSKHGACYLRRSSVLASLPGTLERTRRTRDGSATTARDRRHFSVFFQHIADIRRPGACPRSRILSVKPVIRFRFQLIASDMPCGPGVPRHVPRLWDFPGLKRPGRTCPRRPSRQALTRTFRRRRQRSRTIAYA